MKNIIRISHDATLTSNGTHFNGNCKPVIAIEIQKTFNSQLDAAEYFGVHHTAISSVLNGSQKSIRMYERDENGNKTRYIGPCHLSWARDAASAMDAVMEVGRKTTKELNKANEKISELERKAALWDACQKEQESARKAEEERQTKIAKVNEKRARHQRMLERVEAEAARIRAMLAEEEHELAELEGKGN